MKTTKRLLSFVLVLAMLLTMASFPAVAAGYEYTPKEIVLEGSINNEASNEIRFISRPADYNIFKGDKLVLPEGGLELKKKLKNVTVSSTSVSPDGIVLDVFQNWYGLWSYTDEAAGRRFYLKIDYSASTNGTITGIYGSLADMVEGDPTKALKGIQLNAEGLWAVGSRYVTYNGKEVQYGSLKDYNYGKDNGNAASASYMFTLDVKPAPTTPYSEPSAPAVPASIEADKLDDKLDNSNFKTSVANFTDSTNNIYIKDFKLSGNNIVAKEQNLYHVANASSYVNGAFSGIGITLAAPGYIEKVNFKSAHDRFVSYDVYGSMDGENWYVLQTKADNQTAANSQQTFLIGGIAKYFQITPRDMETTWGCYDGCTLNTIYGYLNIYENLNVTVTNDTDVTKTFQTDANGKVDMSSITGTYVPGKEEGKYIYKIDGVDVTDTIADYMFTADTTVTFEAYVEAAGPVVTFTDGTEEFEAPTKNGYYEIPAKFQEGNFSFYEDANFKTKIDVTAPVEVDTTVYVKEFKWQYTAKTVEFGIKNTPTKAAISFMTTYNGPIIAPRDTIYVGDTMVLPLEAYQNCLQYLSGWQKVTGLDLSIVKYAMSSDGAYFITKLETMADVTYKFNTAGVYGIRTVKVYGLDADGNEVSAEVEGQGQNCVFEVLPQPTSAPKAAVAPSYTPTGTSAAILQSSNETIANTDIAFRKTYGRSAEYNVGGEGVSVLPINKAMGVSNDGNKKFPVSQNLYLQFNLGNLYYVENVKLTGSPIYDYDVYGSIDEGESWYLLNSGVTTNGTYNVGGVAEKIRIVPRQTDGWEATITAYTVNGYAISKNEIGTEVTSSWLKPNGTKETLTFESTLPVAYSDGATNYAITGWKVETGNGFELVDVAVLNERNLAQVGTLVPVLEEIPFSASLLDADLVEQEEDAEGEPFTADNYINGFYVQGAQVRVDQGETSGLRFINVIDNNLVNELNTLKAAGTIKGFEKGTVVIAETKYNGGDLVIGYSDKARAVGGKKIFAKAADFKDAYFKYTVCVTNIDPTHYTTNVIVRPYLTIEIDEDSAITLYGEQYSASVYAAALAGVDKEEDEAKRAALQRIIASVQGSVEG